MDLNTIIGIGSIIVAVLCVFGLISCLKMRKRYLKLLDELEKDPTNKKLRMEILTVGRAFYSICKDRELQIRNDIDARIGK